MKIEDKIVNEIDSIITLLKGDKFDKIVRELQDLLLHEWDKASKESIVDAISRLVKNKGKITEQEMEEIYQQLSTDLGIKFANRVANPIFEAHVESYTHAQRQILGVKPSFNVVDQRAIRALEEHNIYWVKNQWDNNLADMTKEFGKKILEDGISRIKAGEMFATELADKYDAHGTKYWEGFANHIVTRSRSLGQVEAYVKAGVTKYEIRAVLDHRTTPICREMHGRIFEVKDAVKLRDKFINAKSPEDVKDFAPWMREFQVQDQKTNKLPLGVRLPPYHWNCRTRTVVYREPEKEVEKNMGKHISNKDHKRRLDAYSNEEYANWIDSITKREKLSFDHEDLKNDFKKHAPDFPVKFDKKKDFEAWAREAVRNANYVTVRIYQYKGKDKDDLQFYFYSEKNKCYVVVDRGTRIRGCFFHKDIEKAFLNRKDRELWLKLKSKN